MENREGGLYRTSPADTSQESRERVNDWEKKVTLYYAYIDSGDYASLYELFDDEIVYLREGTAPMQGIEALRNFYAQGRIIDTGKHSDIVCTAKSDEVCTKGVFVGVLKNGDNVHVNFQEEFFFNEEGKIIKRRTTFPEGERKI